MPVEINLETPRQDGVTRLLAMSDAYMAELYPSESNHLLGVDALDQPGTDMFVARVDGVVVGCCALVAAKDGTAEIKRMFVDAEARGHSIGRKLMEALEGHGIAKGFTAIRLETGISQPEALGLYRRYGYMEIGAFGHYKPDLLSIFMEKRLKSAR